MIKILTWNVRGLNTSDKQKEVKSLMLTHDPEICCLVETKIKDENKDAIAKSAFGDWELVENNEYHENGRIWVLYRRHLKVEVKYKSAQMVTCLVEAKNIPVQFMCSAVYAFNYEGARQSLWEEMVVTKNNHNLPWILCGDFNCVRYGHEKIGELNPCPTTMEDFNKCLMELELQDLKWWRSKFTWWNQQTGRGRVESKIDRVLVNGDWVNMFPNSYATFLRLGVSNHSPSLVHTQYGICGRPKPFKFFDMWVQHKDFIEVVKVGWNIHVSGSPLFRVTQKLKSIKNKLKIWNRDVFGWVDEKKVSLREEMFKLQDARRLKRDDDNLAKKEREATKKYCEALRVEESSLRQKARVKWLNLGDENNAFFYKSIEQRRNKKKTSDI